MRSLSITDFHFHCYFNHSYYIQEDTNGISIVICFLIFFSFRFARCIRLFDLHKVGFDNPRIY